MSTCQFCAQPADRSYGDKSPMCRGTTCWEKFGEAKRAKNDEALKDPRVQAVRADAAVGSGSCSSIDECMEHVELLEALVDAKCLTPRDAVKWARERDGQYWEGGLEQMFGDGGESDQSIRSCVDESRERNKLPIDC